ncbi:hypothetical protein [Desulfoferrobacter suflitae]|uniref:hypothetical protein n=1 Tax=Desulfoferrobacter suflitae TaxID=2865782 RepID=UPI0021647212|nr:hypothetical protein [Desulfoferrobacter suflitae]MCK8604417.1 hypothetical protein [Desulfoferrobacter suflitae]
MKILRIIFIVLALSFSYLSSAMAGRDVPIDVRLRLLDKGGNQISLPWVKHRVAIFAYEDPENTGLGEDIAILMGREILYNSNVYSLGVLSFTGELSPETYKSLSYFDKVENITKAEDVIFSIWGRIIPVGDSVRVDTFLQFAEKIEDRLSWKFRLPFSMGGGVLQAHLRPKRILIQSIRLDTDVKSEIPNAVKALRTLRRKPKMNAKVVASIPLQKTYSVEKEEGDWVFLSIKSGPKGWTPRAGYCTGSCKQLLEAGRFSGGLLRYVIGQGSLRDATASLSNEALAIEEQIGALDSILRGTKITDISRSLEVAQRWIGPNRLSGKDERTGIDRGNGTPPGGAAFANIEALAKIAYELHKSIYHRREHRIDLSHAPEPFYPRRMYDYFYTTEIKDFESIDISPHYIMRIANHLAKASLLDPNNLDVLNNLAVLFAYAGDQGRANLAMGLGKEIKSKE